MVAVQERRNLPVTLYKNMHLTILNIKIPSIMQNAFSIKERPGKTGVQA
jgi:hypothetical protein